MRNNNAFHKKQTLGNFVIQLLYVKHLKKTTAQVSCMCEWCSEISQEAAMNMDQRAFMEELHLKILFVGG